MAFKLSYEQLATEIDKIYSEVPFTSAGLDDLCRKVEAMILGSGWSLEEFNERYHQEDDAFHHEVN